MSYCATENMDVRKYKLYLDMYVCMYVQRNIEERSLNVGGENSRPTVLTTQQATNSDKQILYVSGYQNNTDCSTSIQLLTF